MKRCDLRRRVNLIFAFLVLIMFGWQSSIAAPTTYDKVTYAAGTFPRAVRMWLPDNAAVPVIKGIIIYGNHTGGEGDVLNWVNTSTNYQKYAASIGWGLMSTKAFTRDMLSGEGQEIVDAIATFASQSGHPELVNVPIAFIGFSNGGAMAYSFNAWKPERTLFFSIDKGGYYTPDTYTPGSTAQLSAAALKTPGFVNAAELDENASYRIPNITNTFYNNYARGANWSFVIEQGVTHTETDTDPVWMKYIDNLIKVRYPANASPLSGPISLLDADRTTGWYVDQSTWQSGIVKIGSYANYNGSTTQQGWVLDQDMAFMYRGFATYNNPLTVSANFDQATSSSNTVTVQVSAISSYTGWEKIEIYNGAIKLGEILPGGNLTFTATNVPGGLYGITALGYQNSGTTLRTSNAIVVLVGGSSSTPPASTTLYQAETLTSSSDVTIDANWTGYTGAGYANFGGINSYMEFNNINASTAGACTFTFTYANGATLNRQCSFTVNGTNVGNIAFAPAQAWTTWGTVAITANLNAGNNTIRVTANTAEGGPNLDMFTTSMATTTVSVTGVTVSPTTASIVAGSTSQLTATVAPANATNETVTWSSSNASVATVNASGLVTAVAAGNATIKAITENGSKTDSCMVTVSNSSSITATQMGMLDFTKSFISGTTTYPALTDTSPEMTGNADVTARLQAAVNVARLAKKSLFLGSGIYKVSDQIVCTMDGGGIPINPTNIIGSAIQHPIIKLENNTAKFKGTNPYAVFQYYSSQGLRPDYIMEGGIRDVDIDLGTGNTNAVGLYWGCAQYCFVENININARDGFAGLTSLGGANNLYANITVTGGKHAIYTTFRDSPEDIAWKMTSNDHNTLTGCTFINQTDVPLVLTNWGAITFIGVSVVKPSGTAIQLKTSNTVQVFPFSLIDSKIEFTSPTTGNIAISNAGKGTITLRGVYTKGAGIICDNNGEENLTYSGTLSSDWTHVKRYNFITKIAQTDDNGGPSMFAKFYNAITATQYTTAIVDKVVVSAPPANLQSKHIWATTPSFEDADAVLITNTTAAGIQAAINANQKVCMPKGAFSLSAPITLKSNTIFIGCPGRGNDCGTYFTYGWTPTAPSWLIETENSASATTYLMDILTKAGDANYKGGVHWQAGKNSIIRDLLIDVDQYVTETDVQKLYFSGNGGGRVFNYQDEVGTTPGNANFRKVKVSGTTQQLTFYGLNLERGGADYPVSTPPMLDLINASHVRVFGAKTETSQPYASINNCKDIFMTNIIDYAHFAVKDVDYITIAGTSCDSIEITNSIWTKGSTINRYIVNDPWNTNEIKRTETLGCYHRNWSSISDVSASPDTQAPTTPTGLSANPGSNTVGLSWIASTDNVGVAGYKLYNDTTYVATATSATYTVAGLTTSTAYTFNVSAIDAAGNESAKASVSTTTTSPDNQVPIVPTNLTANPGSTSVGLSWTASTDNVGVTGYKVYNGTTYVATSTSTTYTVTGLTASTAYTFNVSAIDAAGNESAKASVTTTTNNVPTNIALNKTATASSFETGNTVANGNDGNTATRWCSVDGTLNQWWKVDLGAAASVTGTEITWEHSTVAYKYKIEVSSDNVAWTVAVDKTTNTAVGQVMSDSLTASTRYVRITVTGLPAGIWTSFSEFKVWGTFSPDTQAPTVPAGLSSSAITSTSFTLSWTASTDNVAVTGYDVYKAGVLFGSTASTSISVTGLAASTAYSMTVMAKDFAENISAASTALNITTIAAADTQAPTVPAGLSSSAITSSSFTLSWTASTDNVAVTGYDVYKAGVLFGSTASTSISITGLAASTAYSMTVKAKDAAGNVSAASTALNVTTSTGTTPTNIALNKTATASSFEPGNTVANGNDGNTATRWCSVDGTLNQWWKVDLGAAASVTGTEITWEHSTVAYKYKIEVSSDNVAWTVAVDKTTNTAVGQVMSDSFTASTRYVRITVTGLPAGIWTSFSEFKVWGSIVIVPITSVSVSPTTATIAVGATSQLTATVFPTGATNQTVAWSSSNAAIAAVNATSGLVTGVAEGGPVIITATTQDGNFQNTCTVNVTAVSTNLLTNPGFEVSPITTNWGACCATIAQGTTKNSGTYGLTVTANATYGARQSVTSKIVPLGSGTYYVEAMVKLPSGSASVNIEMQVVSGTTTYYRTPNITVGTTWTKISGILNLNYTGTPTSINWYIYTPATAYFLDDCMLRQTVGGKSAFIATDIPSLDMPTLSVYPNPVQNELTIEMSAIRDNEKARIYDLAGSLIREFNLSSKVQQVNIEDLTNGVYIVRFKESPGLSAKFIKQ